LDRARELFTRVDVHAYEHNPSLGHLISIYENRKDWDNDKTATQRDGGYRQSALFISKSRKGIACEIAQVGASAR